MVARRVNAAALLSGLLGVVAAAGPRICTGGQPDTHAGAATQGSRVPIAYGVAARVALLPP